MPRPSPQSALRAPLNDILGTEANVRLLRVLSLAGTPLTAGELAHRAGLGRTGVYPALAALETTGILQYTGSGAQRQVRFREEHPLAGVLVKLFRAEASRVDALIDGLRSMFNSLVERRVVSAWIDGSALTERASRARQDNADFVTCYLVAGPRELPSIMEEMRSRLAKVERRFEVNMDVVGMTRSEIGMRLTPSAFRDPILLAGVPPLALLQDVHAKPARELRNRIMHGYHDDSGRRLAHAIGYKLRSDPSRIHTAREYLRKRIKVASKQEQHELNEWSRALSLSPSLLQRFLVDPSPRGTRLRQSLPALGLLTSRERDAVLKARSDEEVEAIIAHGGKRGNRDA